LNFVYHVYPYISFNYKSTLKKYFFGGNPDIEKDSEVYKLLAGMAESSAAADYLNLKPVLEETSMNRFQMLNILTLNSALEYFFTDNIYLTRYLDKEFR
jgi:hypothetical protein